MTEANFESNDNLVFIKNLANALKSTSGEASVRKAKNYSNSEISHITPERCGFGETVKLSLPTSIRIKAGLQSVADSLKNRVGTTAASMPAAAAQALIHVCEELDRSVRTDDGSVLITHEAALDLTTGLLDLADILFNASFVLEALALEGIESHILEIMVTPWPDAQK